MPQRIRNVNTGLYLVAALLTDGKPTDDLTLSLGEFRWGDWAAAKTYASKALALSDLRILRNDYGEDPLETETDEGAPPLDDRAGLSSASEAFHWANFNQYSAVVEGEIQRALWLPKGSVEAHQRQWKRGAGIKVAAIALMEEAIAKLRKELDS